MNERIRELMAQAGFDPSAIERMGIMPQAEKFTELIIQECAKHIRDRAFQAGGACTTVGESSLWVAKDLLKQFGVEE